MENFFESPYFKEQIDPLPGAYEALLQLKQRYNLHIITSRQHKLEDITKKWIHTHFPDIFSELHFGNHYATEGKKRSKPEMCREIGAKLLIDDSLVYATQCVQAGIPVVLFGNYAWNQTNSMLQSDYHHSATACPFNQLDGLEIKHYPHECDGSSIKYHSKLIYRTAKWEEVPQLVEIIIKNTN